MRESHPLRLWTLMNALPTIFRLPAFWPPHPRRCPCCHNSETHAPQSVRPPGGSSPPFRKHHIAEAHQFPGIYSRRWNHSRHRIAHSLIVTERLMQMRNPPHSAIVGRPSATASCTAFSHWGVFRQRFLHAVPDIRRLRSVLQSLRQALILQRRERHQFGSTCN